jgi:Fe2+ or Zn2+ uptake regulation protein
MSSEQDAWGLLVLAGVLAADDYFSPSDAKDGFYTKRLKQYRSENPELKVDPDLRAVPDFEELWGRLEEHAEKLAKTDWSLMKATSSLGAKASELGITRLNTRDLQQLLDDAARKNRTTAHPIGAGGVFKVKSTPWVVDGIIRHGSNLLTAPPGAGKSRLSAAVAAAWISGQTEFMGRTLLSPPEQDQRHILIIGTDQNREDWQLTLKDTSLIKPYGTDKSTGEPMVQLHPGLTLHTLEEGIRLDADGLALIRRWCDEHPNCGVIIDSLTACLPTGVDEDKSSAGRPVHELNAALGSCWGLLLHHNRKGAGKDRNIGIGAGRGSGAIDAAVSRVIGMGLIHKMEGGQMVAQESDPRRELISTKRGGGTLHLVVNSNDWSVEGTAEELKRQERQQHLISNLTEVQTNVLSVLEENDNWMTTRDVLKGLGIDYGDGTGSKAAAMRRVLKRLETLELIKSKRVGPERSYHHLNSPEQSQVYKECSNGSGAAAQGISPVQEPVQRCSETSSEPPEHPLNGSEQPELVAIGSEHPFEPPKTQ